MSNLSEVIKSVMANDKMLQDALAAIKEASPSFKDLFKGTFVDKTKVLIKGFATFAVVFKAKALESYGITEEQLIDQLSDYLDQKVELPWYVEYLDGPLFHFLITYGMNYVKDVAASPITAMYAEVIDREVV